MSQMLRTSSGTHTCCTRISCILVHLVSGVVSCNLVQSRAISCDPGRSQTVSCNLKMSRAISCAFARVCVQKTRLPFHDANFMLAGLAVPILLNEKVLGISLQKLDCIVPQAEASIMILVLLQMPNPDRSKTFCELAVVRSSEIYISITNCCKVLHLARG